MRHLLLIVLLLRACLPLVAQDFMMQGWYWDYPKTANGFNWADTLKNKAAGLGNAGFTQLWLPPLSNSSFGNNSNGYDPRDLYDLGEFGGPTGFGTRTGLDNCIAELSANGIEAVADVVYNHRDGGLSEGNTAVEGWIENYNCTKRNSGDNPYPSDRFQCILPLGGASLNGAGIYYFKIASASKHPDFYGNKYKIYAWTNATGYQGLPPQTEQEPNGGSDCSESSNPSFLQLGRDMEAYIDNVGNCAGSCGVDEFGLIINPGNFNASGDTLRIVLSNVQSGYSDHFIYGLWSVARSQDIQSELKYHTYTNFNNLPSGRGGMDWSYFKPNGNPTQLSGDLDFMWFFYDYDQGQQKLRDTLKTWTGWLWDEVGIRGLRMDAVKHFPPSFTGDMMNYLHATNRIPKMVVGEFFDGNPGLLNNWINEVYASMNPGAQSAIKLRLFDFNLRQSLKDACDSFGYDVRNVFNSGMVRAAGSSPYNVVTFVNNHDFRDAGQPVQNDPILTYAYILTNNQIGQPCVFYPDYFGTSIPNAPNFALKPQIDKLMDIHKKNIFGATSIDYLSRFSTPYIQSFFGGFANTTLVYQLGGTPSGNNVIVAINFAGGSDVLRVDHGVNTSGGSFNLTQGSILMDVLKRSAYPYAVVDFLGRIYIELQPRDYSVWVACNIPEQPANAVSQSICQGDVLSAPLSVEPVAGYTYRWYGTATGEASLIFEGVNTYSPPIPPAPGVYEYWVEAVNPQACYSLTRTLVTLTIHPNPGLTVNSFQNASCLGSDDGQATLSATSGTPPYSYFWSDGFNTGSATRLNIPAGNYNITVSDNYGCTGTTALTINQPPFINNPVFVRIKVFLQAPYNTGGGLMSTQLLTNGYLPVAQPYHVAPWNYNGTECVQSLPPNTVDWVLVEVRQSPNSSVIVERRAALLRNDGIITDLNGTEGVAFGNLTGGMSYYVSVKHRNHIGLMSANPLILPNPTTLNLSDFASIEQAATQAALLNGAVYGMFAGDLNGNGVITYADFNLFIITPPGLSTYTQADANLDGTLDLNDFFWYQTNAGKTGINLVRY